MSSHSVVVHERLYFLTLFSCLYRLYNDVLVSVVAAPTLILVNWLVHNLVDRDDAWFYVSIAYRGKKQEEGAGSPSVLLE